MEFTTRRYAYRFTMVQLPCTKPFRSEHGHAPLGDRIRQSNPTSSEAELEQLMQRGEALYDALPNVWGEIDDEGDGEQTR